MRLSFIVVNSVVKCLLVACVLVLSACSSDRIVKMYDGDLLARSELSILTAPENIVILSINGKAVKTYMLSDIEVSYGLKPGQNLVVFQYESVWGKATRGGEDAPRSEKVVSEPREVLVNAKAGDQLNFRYNLVDNVREARALALEFQAEVIDAQADAVAVSTDLGVFEANQPKNIVVTNDKQPETSNLQALEGLKVLWGTASAEEKKTFLVWAFQK